MTATTPATTFTWNVAQMERHTSDGIVFTVHYTVNANDGTYSAGAYGSIGLEAPEGNVIPFADLTPEIVISWTQSKLGVEAVVNIEAALQGQLDEQRQPSKAAGVPWTGSASVTGGATELPAEAAETAPAPEIAPEGDVVDESTVEVQDTTVAAEGEV